MGGGSCTVIAHFHCRWRGFFGEEGREGRGEGGKGLVWSYLDARPGCGVVNNCQHCRDNVETITLPHGGWLVSLISRVIAMEASILLGGRGGW